MPLQHISGAAVDGMMVCRRAQQGTPAGSFGVLRMSCGNTLLPLRVGSQWRGMLQHCHKQKGCMRQARGAKRTMRWCWDLRHSGVWEQQILCTAATAMRWKCKALERW